MHSTRTVVYSRCLIHSDHAMPRGKPIKVMIRYQWHLDIYIYLYEHCAVLVSYSTGGKQGSSTDMQSKTSLTQRLINHWNYPPHIHLSTYPSYYTNHYASYTRNRRLQSSLICKSDKRQPPKEKKKKRNKLCRELLFAVLTRPHLRDGEVGCRVPQEKWRRRKTTHDGWMNE